ncbi:MAG: NUDIX hydrolase [Acetobacteraceae bacterium]
MPQSLLRHIARCRNARLPGTRLRLWLGKTAVGWVTRETAAEIRAAAPGARQDGTGLALSDAAAFEAMGEAIAARGLVRRRNEPFSVRASPDQPELARIDRGALPLLGIWSEGVHVNGLVRRADQPWLWVAERAHQKLLDPGKLDHLVAGGLPAGLSAWDTLCKEAAEEAAIPPALARQAVAVGQTAYVMERPEGLRRDRLHYYDLWVPEDFIPRAADGEVAGFSLWPLRRVLEAVRDTDAFKFNVTLVLIDLFLRFALVDPAGREGRRLRALLDAPVAP